MIKISKLCQIKILDGMELKKRAKKKNNKNCTCQIFSPHIHSLGKYRGTVACVPELDQISEDGGDIMNANLYPQRGATLWRDKN